MASSSSSPARKVSVEQLWNCYALEDEEQRKKLWLDVFLCRAIKGDPFLSGQVSRTRILPHLIAELKNEIGLFCRPSLAADDLEQLKRYFYLSCFNSFYLKNPFKKVCLRWTRVENNFGAEHNLVQCIYGSTFPP